MKEVIQLLFVVMPINLVFMSMITTLYQGVVKKVISGCNKLHAEVVSLCVVPVMLGHKNSINTIKTYALLDNGSHGTFIKESLMEDLTYSQRNLPVNINEVPTPTKIKKWYYLNKIHSFIPQEDEKIIEILIGGNFRDGNYMLKSWSMMNVRSCF